MTWTFEVPTCSTYHANERLKCQNVANTVQHGRQHCNKCSKSLQTGRWPCQNVAKTHAKWKVAMPKCRKYHATWQVLAPNCCKYKAKKSKKQTWPPRKKAILHPIYVKKKRHLVAGEMSSRTKRGKPVLPWITVLAQVIFTMNQSHLQTI